MEKKRKGFWHVMGVFVDMVEVVVLSALAVTGPNEMPVWIRVAAGVGALLVFGGLLARMGEDEDEEDDGRGPLHEKKADYRNV